MKRLICTCQDSRCNEMYFGLKAVAIRTLLKCKKANRVVGASEREKTAELFSEKKLFLRLPCITGPSVLTEG